jgi:hypothetical protein
MMKVMAKAKSAEGGMGGMGGGMGGGMFWSNITLIIPDIVF